MKKCQYLAINQKYKEKLKVSMSYAVTDPETMVIHEIHALIAGAAVMNPSRFSSITFFTLIKLIKILIIWHFLFIYKPRITL